MRSDGLSGALLTAGQVAKLLGVPTSWVYEQSRRGRIPTVTLGRYRRYRLEAIEDWIRNREAGEGLAHGTGRRSAAAALNSNGGSDRRLLS
jgi:excisionase family DNA binding protein